MLYARPWSETSLLVDVFTREFGRFRLLAKGARRQKTGQRALLQPFQPLSISWMGKSGLPILTTVEARNTLPRLRAEALASAYYMSELLFKFLHANDGHETLFEAYEQAIEQLIESNAVESVLRIFECALLSETGYGLQLKLDAKSRQLIDVNAHYFYYPEKGPVQTDEQDNDTGLSISGETLHALATKNFKSLRSQKESKRLLRALLKRQAQGRVFKTREVYLQMFKA